LVAYQSATRQATGPELASPARPARQGRHHDLRRRRWVTASKPGQRCHPRRFPWQPGLKPSPESTARRAGVPARAPNARYLKASFQARPRARRPARQARHAVHAVSGLPGAAGAAASTGITPTITELAAALETASKDWDPSDCANPGRPAAASSTTSSRLPGSPSRTRRTAGPVSPD